ncbi:hypothetical protein [Mycobacteroides abscessus]|uniref:hypothetical protein n=1 Tax=Mycobacteroides abscessus TaxID=36809 RepID=UPI000929B286|nr:hypothetical protein [Mycobacteroides abscessus]SIJ40217.1 Uncharacterised protein [Mycobacteroides abscessus subsp. bolletii]
MSTLSELLTAPSLWLGATVGGLLSAIIAGYFARSNTKDSDERKAKAERERIDKDAVLDAAVQYISTCSEVQMAALHYEAGLLPDVPTDKNEAGIYRLNMAVNLGNQVKAARFRLEMLAPRSVLLTAYPLYTATQDEIVASFSSDGDEDGIDVFMGCMDSFVAAVREYLDKEVVTVDEIESAYATSRIVRNQLRQERGSVSNAVQPSGDTHGP